MNKERLLKLAEHLETGTLGHKVFDFRCWNKGKSRGLPRYKCGYSGCAIGEMPIVDPDYWMFGKYGAPILRGRWHEPGWQFDPEDSAQDYFGISDVECEHLFVDNSQRPAKYGGVYLAPSATKEQVAANIRAFVENMEERGK